ncbi:MAG: hypothetical protein H6895_00545 [Defluviimonas sp.]|uniref:hypothetical protein n=1 Tax=Albidovulum sp. TaxID=1872424 RepID=UPI001D401BF2|nr:hypothetical protein [Paracoccaceae bacterium]MCC0062572.1 hypothetical protein [Defluviimonas sp.]
MLEILGDVMRVATYTQDPIHTGHGRSGGPGRRARAGREAPHAGERMVEKRSPGIWQNLFSNR